MQKGLEEKIELLSRYEFDLESLKEKGFNVINITGTSWDYYGYKYREDTEHHTNALISFECSHSDFESNKFINIFGGANYREQETILVFPSDKPTIINGKPNSETYYIDSPMVSDFGNGSKEMNQVISSINIINSMCSDIVGNNYIIEEIADELYSADNIVIREDFNIDNIDKERVQKTIERLQKLL